MTRRHLWSQRYSRNTSSACSAQRRARLCLEQLEDRTLLSANLLFDSVAASLSILGDAKDTTIRESVSSSGFLEVAVDGQRHSSDPTSAFFDQALAGASGSTLSGISFNGGGHDTLILGSQELAGNLVVSASASIVTEDVVASGQLTIEAPSIEVSGRLGGSGITLAASGLITVEAGGQLAAERLEVSAGVFVNSGQLHADGLAGGEVFMSAGNVLNAGRVSADGSEAGGTVRIAFSGSYMDTTAAVTSADGLAGSGGNVTIDGGSTGRLFSSGRHDATGAVGGHVDLFGQEVVLVGASVDASGEAGGGEVRIGGDFHGSSASARSNALTVSVSAATTIRADARDAGNAGQVVVWSDQLTTFDGSVAARGGPVAGNGGFIEVSSAGNLAYGGTADTGAPAGDPGTLLLDPKNIVISTVTGALPQFNFVDPNPTTGAHFGQSVTVLSNGNVVVTNPGDNFGGTNAGAVYLYDGFTGALISSLVGSSANDLVGGTGIVALSSGHYVIRSVSWNGTRGAVTWASGTAGVSGTVDASNSLVGSNANDAVGGAGISPYHEGGGVTALDNGNYVVRSLDWNSKRGAVTWGSGTSGVSGAVDDTNSLVGSNANDRVGYAMTVLSNGNYVVRSPYWNGNSGAATWGSATSGVSGAVDATNSLVGSSANDYVGFNVFNVGNGNYVVVSSNWNGNRGAVTWASGTAGVTGTIDASNSLVGSNANDYVGYYGYGIIALSNGNYVVRSPNWNGNRGAATWASGTAGVTGTVSASNSLIGSSAGDSVGFGGAALTNGNYVVASPSWNDTRGAATWSSGTAGITGTIDSTNSLVGSSTNDQVGASGITALANGNYAVGSPYWNGGRGALTWSSGTAGVTGTISSSNSLVGSNANDNVGGGGSVVPLGNGNYVVRNFSWNGKRGAVTWASGAAGVTGTVSASNSLVGASDNDSVGSSVTVLSNGNYVVNSSGWNGTRGAATWGSGTAGISGTISASNSLVGSSSGDAVASGGIYALSNGNYVVSSWHWNGNTGAATWSSGSTGLTGTVSASNSLVGSNANDYAGIGVVVLGNGNYVVDSQYWNGNRGAVTWGSGTAGVTGTVGAGNSLLGVSANDKVGSGGIVALSDGNYVVGSPSWFSGRGAATWTSGTTGRTVNGSGTITAENSLVGATPNAGLRSVAEDSVTHTFLASFYSEGTGRVTAGLVDPNLLTFARGQSQTVSITPAMLTRTLNTGGAVVLQASNDITINAPITVSAGGSGGALTFEAGRSILINASITTDNGALTLIANDTLAHGVVDAQRDPGNAVITMAFGTTLNTGTGALTVELRDGAGLTNNDSGAITLRTVTAGSVAVTNNGPTAASDAVVGPVTSTAAQTYTNANGTTVVAGNLSAASHAITFFDSVALNASITASAVNFAGTSTQDLGGTGGSLPNLVHNGSGTLRLTSDLTVSGAFTNSSGTFDANGQAVTVGGLTTIASGTQYLGSTGSQSFGGGLSLPAGGSLDGGNLTLGGNVSAGEDSSANPATISGNLSLGGATRTFTTTAGSGAVQLLVSAVVSDSGGAGLTKAGAGTLLLQADNTYTGTTTVQAGLLVVDGTQASSNVTLSGGTLGGVGTVGAITASGGTLRPGDPDVTGILTASADVSLASAATFGVRLDGTTAGSGYDQLNVTGAVNLNSDAGAGSRLAVSVGFTSAVGDTFTILTATGGITGTFQGLDEGATFTVGGMNFQITYQGAGGTAVVLTHVA
jgi:autotransporter-associated beta strand protein